MEYQAVPAKITPYVPVQHKLFKDAFFTNYRRARNLQRDMIFWFTSSRFYRVLAAITICALLVLGAAVCQLKAMDYSPHFVHRNGANFVWAFTSLCFCSIEFARVFRRKNGQWTWEVCCAAGLVVVIIITGLSIANNVVAVIELAPDTYQAKATTPLPNYFGWNTTPRFMTRPPRKTSTITQPMTTGLLLNEWDTYQWSLWKKAVFVLYCFCTVTQGIVLLFMYLPYVFMKFSEFKLAYGRRLLSNDQIYGVTKNAFRAYQAAVYNRQRLQHALDNERIRALEGASPGGFPEQPSPCAGCPVYKTKKQPRPPSTVSSGGFKRAIHQVKPRKHAWFPHFQAPSISAVSTYYTTSPVSSLSSYTVTPPQSSTTSYYTSSRSASSLTPTSASTASGSSETNTQSTSRSSRSTTSQSSRSYTYGDVEDEQTGTNATRSNYNQLSSGYYYNYRTGEGSSRRMSGPPQRSGSASTSTDDGTFTDYIRMPVVPDRRPSATNNGTSHPSGRTFTTPTVNGPSTATTTRHENSRIYEPPV